MSPVNHFGIEFIIKENEIYLDSATTGKLPQSSLNIMNDFYVKYGGGINRGTHKIAIDAGRILEDSRSNIGEIFSINQSQLSFLPSRETALVNILFSQKYEKDSEIITSTLDEHSIIIPLLNLKKKFGINLNFTGVEDEIHLISSIQEKISPKTKAIVLSSLTLGMGIKRDWKEIVKVADDNDVILILDISNGIGHFEFNFRELAPHIIISSSNIGALGPSGVAFQIIREDFTEKFDPILVGNGAVVSVNRLGYKLSSMPYKFEPSSLNLPSIAGLANSLRLLSEVGFLKIENHEQELRKSLLDGLTNIKNINIVEKEGLSYGPILSFYSETIDSHDLAIILEDLANIYVRSGALCSHLFMDEIKKDSLVQISTHLYNTKEDITILLDTLDSIISEM